MEINGAFYSFRVLDWGNGYYELIRLPTQRAPDYGKCSEWFFHIDTLDKLAELLKDMPRVEQS